MATTAKRVKDAKKPKFKSRQHNRCQLCGRPRAFLRKFGVCRLCFRGLALKGEIPLGLVVLKANVMRPHREIAAELVRMVREKIGPVAAFKVVAVVRRLPKTRSGKIVRGVIKKIADGDDYRIPPTIEDATVFDEIAADLNVVLRERDSGTT